MSFHVSSSDRGGVGVPTPPPCSSRRQRNLVEGRLAHRNLPRGNTVARTAMCCALVAQPELVTDLPGVDPPPLNQQLQDRSSDHRVDILVGHQIVEKFVSHISVGVLLDQVLAHSTLLFVPPLIEVTTNQTPRRPQQVFEIVGQLLSHAQRREVDKREVQTAHVRPLGTLGKREAQVDGPELIFRTNTHIRASSFVISASSRSAGLFPHTVYYITIYAIVSMFSRFVIL